MLWQPVPGHPKFLYIMMPWTGKSYAASMRDGHTCLCRLQRTQDLRAASAQTPTLAFSVCRSVHLRSMSTSILRYGFLSWTSKTCQGLSSGLQMAVSFMELEAMSGMAFCTPKDSPVVM